MSIHRHLPALAGAIALGFAAAGAVVAQDQGPPPAQGGSDAHHGWRGDPAAMKQRMEERRAEHAKVLHDALSIRPDQEAAFQAFIASMGHGEHQHRMGEHRQPGETLTTPERLDRMSQRMGERQAAFQRRADATKAFYAVLSPEQRRTFDALGAMHGHGGMGGHRGGHMGGGHDGQHGPGEG